MAFVNTFTNWSLFKILDIWEFSTKLLPLRPSELLMANKQVTSLPKQLAKLDIKCPSWGFKDLIPNSSLWIRSFTESKNATHLTGPSYSFTIFLQQIRNHMKSWVSFHTIMEPLHDISPTMSEKVRLKRPDDFYAWRPSSPSCHACRSLSRHLRKAGVGGSEMTLVVSHTVKSFMVFKKDTT